MSKKKNLQKGFVAWLVRVLKPGYHLSKNPKTHTKNRKPKAGEFTGLTGVKGQTGVQE